MNYDMIKRPAGNVVDFSQYKANKKLDIIEQDLKDAIQLLGLMYQALGEYKKYSPINTLMFDVLNQKTLLNKHLRKCKELRNSNDQLEKPIKKDS